MKENIKFINFRNIFFYILFILILSFFLSMNPFLKFPFDMYRHLVNISDISDGIYHGYRKLYWHQFWAYIFDIFNINSTQIFKRAYIIHITQTIISFLSIYFFSYSVFRFLFVNIQTLLKKYLALWATIIWFTIYATSSGGYHLVWIQWYSINHQITLPLTFFAIGILLHIIFGEYKFSKKIILNFLLISVLVIVLSIHSMEFLYFLLYVLALFFIFFDKVIYYLKQHKILFYIFLFTTLILLSNLTYIIHVISYRMPKIFTYFDSGSYGQIWDYIIRDGYYVVNKLNRAFASMNELIYLSLILIPIIILIYIFNFQKFKFLINLRLLILILLGSLFVLIPLNPISAGIAGELTYLRVVNRFYYSSSIFLIVPIFSIFLVILFNKIREKLLFINITILITIISVYNYSKYAKHSNQNYYKNIQSIKNSFNKRKTGFNLSQDQIRKLGNIINRYKDIKKVKLSIVSLPPLFFFNKYKSDENEAPYFYTRGDIAFILKYIYKKNVYLIVPWNGRKWEQDFYIKAYNKDIIHKNKVLLKAPKGFPDYEPYR